ncbi:hypothetical protein BI308_25860 [Roseofilum reptotaenium AO1-A]|uniref:HTH cro/C1-type domain-containing protein n=1 Tax=Roseofilum reptotaenium AO1-A TaxID=1925591 RepID=A0A1L9QC47_9CYAN|nr:hypothetical protein BI308_25860 [Roseofilum reptotaenium AO1-A]
MNQRTEKGKLLFAPVEIDDIYPLERLRKERTDLIQEDFVKKCKMSATTYRRCVSSNKPPRLEPKQIQTLCRILDITFDEYCDLFKSYE